ncbi:hypothetical protein E4U23_000921, partial [Claviceps purpurea]
DLFVAPSSSSHVLPNMLSYAVNTLAVPILLFIVLVFVIPDLLSPVLFDRHHRLRRLRPT